MSTLEARGRIEPYDTGVVHAAPDDREAVADVLARAFQSDPVARWSFPDPATYHAAFSAFANGFGGAAFDYGTAWLVPGLRGAALWLPPGVGPDEQAVAAVFERYTPADRLQQVFALMEQRGRHHPPMAHWYLPLIGVDPADQGRGHGSALLRAATDRLDRDGQVAYLESTSAMGVPLYRRHGFEVVATIQVAAAPPVYPMMREPRYDAVGAGEAPGVEGGADVQRARRHQGDRLPDHRDRVQDEARYVTRLGGGNAGKAPDEDEWQDCRRLTPSR